MEQQTPAETMPQPQQRSAWLFAWLSPRRPRFWLLAALLLYALAGFFLAPWLIERTATKKISEAGRSLELGKVRVNPFALSLALRNVELRDTDSEVLFSLGEGYVNFQLSSLFRRAWTFSEFRLIQPYLNVERYGPGNDRIGNFVNALAPGAGEKEDESTSADLPRLTIQKLDWSNGQVAFTDHLENQVFKTESGPINISVNDLSTLPEHTGRQKVSIVTHSGGSVGWSGELQLAPLRSQGRLTISGKALTDAGRYLSLFLPFAAQAGDLNVTLDYRIAMERPGDLELKVENLGGEARDVGIQLADGSEILKLPNVGIAGGTLAWPGKTAGLQSLTINGALLNIARLPDGGLDLGGLLPAPAEPAAPADSVAPTDKPDSVNANPVSEWAVEVQQLVVSDASVHFEDRSLEPAGSVRLQKVNVSASGIKNRPDASFPAHIEFRLAEGGTFTFDGEAKALPEFSAVGEVTIDGANFVIAQPWIAGLAHVAVKSGTASLKGQIVHDPEEMAGYQGSVRIDGFDLDDTSRIEPLLELDSLEVERVEFSLSRRSAVTSLVQLTRAHGRIAIAPDRTTNLHGLMVQSEATPAETDQPSAAKPLAVKIDGFEIADASLDFSDHALPLPFSAAIRSLGGTVSTLSNTSAEPAQVQLEGQVNEYGLARITGSINAWSPTENSAFKVIFRNLETARLTPYTIGFAGYKIADGRLDLDLDYEVRQGKMQGTNKIVSRQLKLGEKVENPDGASLPLQLAVALLTDSNGVIDFDLPVSGDFNDPEFRLGGVIAKAIGGLIVKIITSPFRLLGMLVGVDSEDFGSINFVAGSAEVSPPDREKLVKLAEAMRQRPELQLEVAGVYAAESDRAALQSLQLDAELQARMDAEMQGGDELSGVTRRRVTEALFVQTFPDIALEGVRADYMHATEPAEAAPAQPALDETAYLADLRQRLVEQQPVSDEEIARLANARADAVIALLQGGSDSELPLERVEAEAVNASSSGEISLELGVSVAKHTE